MTQTAGVNLYVDAEVKEQAGKILADMGLSLSEAFNLMLHQVRIQRALPFELVSYGRTPRPETLLNIESIENGLGDMAGPFETYEEYKIWVDEDDEDEI